MDLEDRNSLSDQCDYDSVSVYDGDSQTDTLLGRWCGTEHPPSLVSKGNKLLVVLSTDRDEAHRGFTASYLGGKRSVLQHLSLIYSWLLHKYSKSSDLQTKFIH